MRVYFRGLRDARACRVAAAHSSQCRGPRTTQQTLEDLCALGRGAQSPSDLQPPSSEQVFKTYFEVNIEQSNIY